MQAPELAPWDCQSQAAEGREKVRIQKAQALQQSLRANARGVTGKRKRESDGEDEEQDAVTESKKQKKTSGVRDVVLN